MSVWLNKVQLFEREIHLATCLNTESYKSYSLLSSLLILANIPSWRWYLLRPIRGIYSPRPAALKGCSSVRPPCIPERERHVRLWTDWRCGEDCGLRGEVCWNPHLSSCAEDPATLVQYCNWADVLDYIRHLFMLHIIKTVWEVKHHDLIESDRSYLCKICCVEG